MGRPRKRETDFDGRAMKLPPDRLHRKDIAVTIGPSEWQAKAVEGELADLCEKDMAADTGPGARNVCAFLEQIRIKTQSHRDMRRQITSHEAATDFEVHDQRGFHRVAQFAVALGHGRQISLDDGYLGVNLDASSMPWQQQPERWDAKELGYSILVGQEISETEIVTCVGEDLVMFRSEGSGFVGGTLLGNFKDLCDKEVRMRHNIFEVTFDKRAPPLMRCLR